MKDKPRISKGDNGWQVDLPSFGFGVSDTTVVGFRSREDAFGWLSQRKSTGSASQIVAQSAQLRPSWADMNLPMVIQ